MFDIVAAHQNQPAPVVDRGGIGNRQAGIFAAAAGRHAWSGEHFVEHEQNNKDNQRNDAVGNQVEGVCGNATEI